MVFVKRHFCPLFIVEGNMSPFKMIRSLLSSEPIVDLRRPVPSTSKTNDNSPKKINMRKTIDEVPLGD